MATISTLDVRIVADASQFQRGINTAKASLQSFERSTGTSSAGLNKLSGAIRSIAANALNTAPGVAQLSSVIGSMALGSGMMIGVMAGVAALGHGWSLLTREAREIEAAAKDARKAIEDLGKSETVRLVERQAALNAAIAQPKGGIKAGIAAAAGLIPGPLGAAVGRFFGERADVNRAIEDAKLIQKAEDEKNRLQAEGARKRAAEAKRAADAVGRALEQEWQDYQRWFERMRKAVLPTMTALSRQALTGGLEPVTVGVGDRLSRMRVGRGAGQVGMVGQVPKVDIEQLKRATALHRQLIQLSSLLEEASWSMANSMTDAFGSIVAGTESVGRAFRRMVGNILAELARLAAQRMFTQLIGRVISALPSGATGGLEGDAQSGTWGATRQQSSGIIVQQSITYAPSFIDARGAAAFVREQGNEIRQLVAEGAQQSAAYAKMIRGR